LISFKNQVYSNKSYPQQQKAVTISAAVDRPGALQTTPTACKTILAH